MSTIAEPWMWVAFSVLVVVTMGLDLGVFHRSSHTVSFKEAGAWTAVWVSLAAVFCTTLWLYAGPERGLEFLTGYLVEYALSVDNIFIFLVIFATFKVPAAFQHRVLFWGVLGAVVLRAIMIVAGSALLARFHWLIYIFGGFLIFTGIKMLRGGEGEEHPEDSAIFKLFKRIVPATHSYHGDKFFVVEAGKRLATPLFLVLLLVEFTDVIFALDSIPAIFAITRDPFIVFTSNIFAILGLRNLFFLLAGIVHRFAYLKVGLGLTLVFIGTKMAIAEWYHVPVVLSLAIVASLIGGSMIYSVWRTRWMQPPPSS